MQSQLTNENEFKYASKEFAFTQLMKCGHCDSGVTAQEKYKKLKDGSTVKYIYYGCTRSKNLHCKEGYLREEELILQLINIIDRISLDELGLRKKLKEEVDRYHKFQNILGTEKQKVQLMDIDMKNYAKYILKEGNLFKKRELLSHLKNRVILKEKLITLA